MGQECFGGDKAGGAGGGAPPGGGLKAPAAGGIAGTHDPNYQTLAGMGQDCFGNDKAAGGGGGGGGGFAPAAGGAGPKAPAAGGIADTHDPNNQTLAAVGGGDCFGADMKVGGAGGGGPKPGAVGVAGTNDPNPLAAVGDSVTRIKMVSSTGEKKLHILDVDSETEKVIQLDTEITALAISPDGNYILAGGYRFIKLFDVVHAASPLDTYLTNSCCRDIGFFMNGVTYYTGGDDGVARVFDRRNPMLSTMTALRHRHELDDKDDSRDDEWRPGLRPLCDRHKT
uniref:WD_REPEATS_REGION domain-containing protein n=1 Tax=Panagrellus redivivus TaxID=6233 RepID=A0A7E4VFZ6_PANRE